MQRQPIYLIYGINKFTNTEFFDLKRTHNLGELKKSLRNWNTYEVTLSICINRHDVYNDIFDVLLVDGKNYTLGMFLPKIGWAMPEFSFNDFKEFYFEPNIK